MAKLKPLSLAPLTSEEALRRAMQAQPHSGPPSPKKRRTKHAATKKKSRAKPDATAPTGKKTRRKRGELSQAVQDDIDEQVFNPKARRGI